MLIDVKYSDTNFLIGRRFVLRRAGRARLYFQKDVSAFMGKNFDAE